MSRNNEEIPISTASYNARFKAYIQKEGRVQIPKAEMDAANLEPNDLVQVRIRRIEKSLKEKALEKTKEE